MKKIMIFFLVVMVMAIMFAMPAMATDSWNNFWYGNNSGYSGSSNSYSSGGYGTGITTNNHRVEAVSPLKSGGYLVILEDGRVVTISPSGKIVADNNQGRIVEQIIPWAAIVGIISILK